MTMQISQHFNLEEVSCRCGCGQAIILPAVIGLLECIRGRVGPLEVFSYNRCLSHNKFCGGVDNSFHMYGLAVDIYSPNCSLDFLAETAAAAGADGIGIYRGQMFVHVDKRGLVGHDPGARWEE